MATQMINSLKYGNNTHPFTLPYGVCDTAAATAAKEVTVDNFSLEEGAAIIVKFTYENSIASPTLNVNGTGAKPIYRYNNTTINTGTTTTGWIAGAVQLLVYDGAGWIRTYWNNTTYSNVSLGQGYATCSTAAATAAKVASLSSYKLVDGGIVSVRFTYDVPANATLNINSTGAKAIYHRNAKITNGIIKAGDTATFIYSTYYRLISIDREPEITTGTSNGTIAVDGTDVAVKGLGNAAYTASTDYTPVSILPRDGGEIKTRYRIANKGFTGSSDTVWYYKLCDFPTNNSGNYASAILSGRIGGWLSHNESYINALAWNRDTPGISLIDIAGLASDSSHIWNICDLVLYSNGSAASNTTASLYLKCKEYFVYDLNLELFQSNATITYDGTYTTSTPTGTLIDSASSCRNKMEIANGKLFVNGEEMAPIDSPAFTGIPTAPTPSSDNNSTQLATTAFVKNLINGVLAGEVTFKGTASSLPSSPVNGDMYKVTAAIAQASNMDAAARVGDTIIYYAANSKWYVIPSGDTDSDTWRPISVNGTLFKNAPISSGNINFKDGSGISITTSGNDVTIGHSNSITPGTATGGSGNLNHGDSFTVPSITYNGQGHITNSGITSYTLPTIPVASSDVLGGIKSGTDITIDSNGNVSVNDNSHNHNITANANDDDIVVLTGTSGVNTTTYTASHAKKGPSSGYTSGNTTTSISGAGASGSIKIPQITVDSYGHVTDASDEVVTFTMPSYSLSASGATVTLTGSDGSTSNGTINTILNGTVGIKVSDSNEISFISNANYIYFGYDNRGSSSGIVDTYKFGTHSGAANSAKGKIECGEVIENGTSLSSKYASKSNATTSTAGLMSAADKTKLDGIATGANKYTLPTASSSTLGGVKTGSNITNSSGTISLTKDNVISALGYTPPTTNTTYSAGTGISLSGTTFSNSGVRSVSTGSTNGTISVNTNGSSSNVAVKGLGSAAYTNSTAYAPAYQYSTTDLTPGVSSLATGTLYFVYE